MTLKTLCPLALYQILILYKETLKLWASLRSKSSENNPRTNLNEGWRTTRSVFNIELFSILYVSLSLCSLCISCLKLWGIKISLSASTNASVSVFGRTIASLSSGDGSGTCTYRLLLLSTVLLTVSRAACL